MINDRWLESLASRSRMPVQKAEYLMYAMFEAIANNCHRPQISRPLEEQSRIKQKKAAALKK